MNGVQSQPSQAPFSGMFLLARLTCALACSTASSFSAPLGLLDQEGGFACNLPLTEVTADSFTVPIELHVSSAPQISGILPDGWLLPILDSCAFLDPDGEPVVILPTGETIHPSEHSGNENDWKIEQSGNKIMVFNGRFVARFEGGRIVHYSRVNENGFVWKRGDQKTEILYDGFKVFEAESENSGPDHTLTLKGSGENIEIIAYQPRFSDTLATDGAVLPSVSLIRKGGREYCSFEKRLRSAKIELEFAGDSYSPPARLVHWRCEDGRVSEIDGRRYLVENAVVGRSSFSLPRIERIESDGSSTILQPAMYLNGMTGVETESFDLNNKTERYYVNSGKWVRLRKEVHYSNGEPVTGYTASFDEKGVPLRETNGSFTRTFDGEKFRVFKDGILLREY